MTKYKAISFGLGPIGSSIARLALTRKNVDIVGAVDSNQDLVGKDLSEIVGIEKLTGVKVTSSGRELYRQADIVLHATSSFLSAAEQQLLEFCQNGVDVVSTNEELSFPWFNHKETARKLDEAAKKNDVTLLGTGVNPGFVMDALPTTLSGACASVSEIFVTRILDATKRRIPFQKKVGIGLTTREFDQNVSTGKFGHIGCPESIALTCSALGLEIERIEQHISPKITDDVISTEHFGVIEKGRVIGLIQDAQGFAGGRKVAQYHIEMYAGAKDPYDEIELRGVPSIKLKIPGGTPGDVATAALIVNSIPRVIESEAGLKTVRDLRPAASVFEYL